MRAMESCEIPDPKITGRNDIEVNGFKISGSAYKLNLGMSNGVGKKTLHHGTLLRNANTDILDDLLSPSKLKLQGKGVQSVRARVMNLNEICPNLTHESWCEALQESFVKFHKLPHEVQIITADECLKVPKIKSTYE